MVSFFLFFIFAIFGLFGFCVNDLKFLRISPGTDSAHSGALGVSGDVGEPE